MPSRLIALLFEFATLNGGERSMLAVIDWLRMADSELEFVAIAPEAGSLGNALHERGVSIIDWRMHDDDEQRRSADQIEDSLVQIIATRKPDLVHANSLSMGRLTGRIANRLAVPTTAHLRDIIKLNRTTIGNLNRNRRLVAVSQATRAFHVNQGLDSSRISVVRNGVDLDLFRPKPASGNLIFELKINPSRGRPRMIATIGQIGLRKGQDVLAVAARSIGERVPNVHFLMIGERNSQKQESIEFEQSILRSFASAGLSDQLHVMGYREDISSLLNEVDLLVHPAHQEPFGRVLLEASAAGIPIVATNVGGTAEIIVDGITGILVPPGDAGELADAVVKVLSNPADSLALGQRARERALREFAISNAAENLVQIWKEVLSE